MEESDPLYEYYKPIDGAIGWVEPFGEIQFRSKKCRVLFINEEFEFYFLFVAWVLNEELVDEIQGTEADFEPLEARDIVLLKQQGVLNIEELPEI